MIISGFHSSMTLFIVSNVDRVEMKKFFRDLIKFLYLNAYVEHKLISDRLYRKYIKDLELPKIYNLVKKIEFSFLMKNESKREIYAKYINIFYKACKESLELLDMGINSENKLRVSLNIPYSIEEGVLNKEFYDNLPNTAEPFWLREVSMDEYVKKYSR